MLPLWTPDGKRIAYGTKQKGEFVILLKAADGSANEEQLASSPDRLICPWCWSGDGKTLIVFEHPLNPGTNTDIGAVSMEGNHSHRLLLNSKYDDSQPQISPDGLWIAYTSNESGQNEVFVRPYPQVGKDRWQVSLNGGDAALWSPDGRELLFHSGGAVVAVPAKTDPTFSFGKQQVLFRGDYFTIYTDILSRRWRLAETESDSL
jgi:Tol biopolymer transport system component